MPDEQPPHAPSSGDQSGWAALSTLLSGIVLWGGIGAFLDWWLDIPNRLGLLIGMIVGLVTALYLVMKKFG